jgi:8-oxo-dGTP pyrophosphatase MutT (NUDIX family)
MRRTAEPFRLDATTVSELAAGAVLAHESSGLILLLHHVSEDRWCFPKGHVEAGESVRQAAQREVEEETGIHDFRLLGEVGSVTYRFYDPRRKTSVVKTSIYLLGVTRVTTAIPEELFDDYRWVEPGEAAKLVAYDTDREILRAAETPLAARSGK